jgi:hypothetical protein
MTLPRTLHDIAISLHGGASEKRRPRTLTVRTFQSRANADALLQSFYLW